MARVADKCVLSNPIHAERKKLMDDNDDSSSSSNISVFDPFQSK
jgi:hypothetical protein